MVKRKWRTPPDIAADLGCKPESVIGWIRRGELDAVDVSSRPGSGRPRFRVSEEALQEFLARRSVQPPPKRSVRRKLRDDDVNVIEFY